jgi:hypothetical protein
MTQISGWVGNWKEHRIPPGGAKKGDSQFLKHKEVSGILPMFRSQTLLKGKL